MVGAAVVTATGPRVDWPLPLSENVNPWTDLGGQKNNENEMKNCFQMQLIQIC